MNCTGVKCGLKKDEVAKVCGGSTDMHFFIHIHHAARGEHELCIFADVFLFCSRA